MIHLGHIVSKLEIPRAAVFNFMTFNITEFMNKLWNHFNFGQNQAKIMYTLHKGPNSFLHISHQVFMLSCRQQNKLSVLNYFCTLYSG